MKTIDLTHSPRIELPFIDEDAAKQVIKKGWSLSSVYYFSEIRDVYLTLKDRQWRGLGDFTDFCLSTGLPFVRTRWNKRRILEHVNAVINFGLVSSDYKISRDVFVDSRIGSSLSDDDLAIFKEIYFDYFRFKELFSWFIEPNPASRLKLVQGLTKEDIETRTKPLFAFSENAKFTNSWFCELTANTPVYYIRGRNQNPDGKDVPGNEDLMRFWDCFLAWGSRLGVLEKFTLADLGIKTCSGKDILCCYVINNNIADFDLLEYLDRQFSNSHIYLPDLVFRLATDFRMSLTVAHELLIEQYRSHRESLSFERTSEIFIKRGEIRESDKILFPKYRDSYISHLVIRR